MSIVVNRKRCISSVILIIDSLLSSIEMTKEILQQTAPIMSQLDSMNREANQLRPSLAAERR